MILQRMVQWTGKLIGGLVGLVSGGPIGAAVGVLVGHQVDRTSQDTPVRRPALDSAAVGDRFFRMTFQVMGHIAKADGRVSEQEIAAARAVMSDLRLDAAQVRAAIGQFTIGKQRNFNLTAALDTLAHACSGRPDLTRVFVEIQMRAALGGSNLGPAARELMRRVAARLGVSGVELAHIEAVLRMRAGAGSAGGSAPASQTLEEAYSVLEVSGAASDEELAKSYRRQLSRHHPDKLKANGLPDSMVEHAKQRTQQIIEAYELVRERRGI